MSQEEKLQKRVLHCAIYTVLEFCPSTIARIFTVGKKEAKKNNNSQGKKKKKKKKKKKNLSGRNTYYLSLVISSVSQSKSIACLPDIRIRTHFSSSCTSIVISILSFFFLASRVSYWTVSRSDLHAAGGGCSKHAFSSGGRRSVYANEPTNPMLVMLLLPPAC